MARPTKEEQARKRAAEDERIAQIVADRLEAAKAEMRVELQTQLLAQIAAATEPAEPATANLAKPLSPTGERSFAEAIALAIGNLANQGTGKAPYFPPEQLNGWRLAQERMANLIIEARAKYGVTGDAEDLPKYRVIKTQYLNEVKIEPQYHDVVTHRMTDQFIRWDEPPNEGMEPANDVARAVFAAFMESIGEVAVKEKGATSLVRTEKGTLMGIKGAGQRAGGSFNAPTNDPRISTAGSPHRGTPVHLLGTIAAPAVVK